jgi:DNA-binding response OmpR family regulator
MPEHAVPVFAERDVAQPKTRSLRVFLIQDDADRRTAVRDFLQEQRFEVIGHTRAEALSALSDDVDCVVIDMDDHPDHNLAILKVKRERGLAVPIIALCQSCSAEHRVATWDQGADYCFGVDSSLEELAACLRGLARRINAKRASVPVSFADLTLEIEKQRITRGGHSIALTRSEFSLLLLFLRHPEQVLERDQLYNAMSSSKPEGKTIALEVHIMRLRRKIETHGGRLIHSVYGRGYILTERARSTAV